MQHFVFCWLNNQTSMNGTTLCNGCRVSTKCDTHVTNCVRLQYKDYTQYHHTTHSNDEWYHKLVNIKITSSATVHT